MVGAEEVGLHHGVQSHTLGGRFTKMDRLVRLWTVKMLWGSQIL